MRTGGTNMVATVHLHRRSVKWVCDISHDDFIIEINLLILLENFFSGHSPPFVVLRGHPVLLAETFVDPSRFRGTCYRAAGWTALGETRGFACDAGGWWEHGWPKTVLVRPLRKVAAEALSGLGEPAP